MTAVARLFGLLACLANATAARAALNETLAATQLFSGLIETRVVRFELPVAGGAAPKKIHAVTLSFDGLLWLYTPGLGTCLLDGSRTAAGPDAIAAHLQRLEPAAREIQVYAHPVLPPPETSTTLRNGCVAACLLDLASLLVRNDSIDAAGLVFLTPRAPDQPATGTSLLNNLGHGLLVYHTRDHWWALDPAERDTPFALQRVEADAPLDPAIEAHVRRHHYAADRVRFLPFSAAALESLGREARWIAARPVAESIR
jgi:hypothetical protein